MTTLYDDAQAAVASHVQATLMVVESSPGELMGSLDYLRKTEATLDQALRALALAMPEGVTLGTIFDARRVGQALEIGLNRARIASQESDLRGATRASEDAKTIEETLSYFRGWSGI